MPTYVVARICYWSVCLSKASTWHLSTPSTHKPVCSQVDEDQEVSIIDTSIILRPAAQPFSKVLRRR